MTGRRVPRRYRERSVWRRWVWWWRRHLRPRWLRPRVDWYAVRLWWRTLLLRVETWWFRRGRKAAPPPPAAQDEGAVPPLTDEQFERIMAQVRLGIAAIEAGEMEPPLSPDPQRRTLVLAFALVAAAVLAAGTFLAFQIDLGDGAVAGDPDGPVEVEDPMSLASLARVARQQAEVEMEEGDVLVLTIDHVPTAEQEAQGGVGRREVRQLTLDGRGEVAWGSVPGAPGTYPDSLHSFDRPGSLTVGNLAPEMVLRLPGDPEALRTILGDPVETGGSSLDPSHVLVVLATPLASARARAGLFHLLGSLGAEVAGPATDGAGRPGVAVVAATPGGGRVTAVVDPATARVLSLARSQPGEDLADRVEAVYREVIVRPQ